MIAIVNFDTGKMEEVEECQNCKLFPAMKLHLCPAKDELHDDKTLCNCCVACCDECHDEI